MSKWVDKNSSCQRNVFGIKWTNPKINLISSALANRDGVSSLLPLDSSNVRVGEFWKIVNFK